MILSLVSPTDSAEPPRGPETTRSSIYRDRVAAVGCRLSAVGVSVSVLAASTVVVCGVVASDIKI
jgi:hypothetical protein